MGIGPVFAGAQAAQAGGPEARDIDLVELNEAFRLAGALLPRPVGLDPESLNPNGGAISIGHPTG